MRINRKGGIALQTSPRNPGYMVIVGTNVMDYGPITPSDSTNLSKPAIGILVTGNAGDIAVVKPNGEEVTIPESMVTVGEVIPLPARRIKSTGTTATGIWAVYGS